MANRPGLMSGIWQNIKKSIRIARAKEVFVGADQYGNKYFERPAGNYSRWIVLQPQLRGHMGQGPVLLTFLRHVARISANGIAAFKESCSPIG